MEIQKLNKLDNPVWYSLAETHSPYCLNYDHLKCYDPEFCSFGAIDLASEIHKESLADYSKLIDNFFIVGNKPFYSTPLNLKNELICLQMVHEKEIEIGITERIVELNLHYEEQLFTLVNQIQPGYFKRKTSQLGKYYGIIKDGELIAVSGERLQMNEFTEVSAVVTDPQHTGKGYASQLIAHTVRHIILENKVPFLHVAQTNLNAIKLYEKLGFNTRRKISFWNFIKDPLL